MWKKKTNHLKTYIPSTSESTQNLSILQLLDVSKVYNLGTTGFPALKNINANFYSGEFVGIMGKSGAGKTTLINMLSATDHVSEGEVIVHGVSIHKLKEDQAAQWRGQKMGIVYQSFRLMPTLSLIDNIRLPIDFCGKYSPKVSLDRAMQLLEEVELQDHAFKSPSAISGGQQQRIAIARALANDPSIILADEPTGRLDSVTAESIVKIFNNLVKLGKLVIMATHDLSLNQYFSRQITLVDGVLTSDQIGNKES